MSDTKWADVAHYYAKSNLSIIVGKFDHGPEMGMIFSKGLHENCEWAEHGIWCQIENGAFISEWGSHKPILRHLDDMTESECIDYTEFVWADSEFSKVNRSQKISVVWAKDSVNLREMYRKCLFAVRQKGIMWPFFPKDINQLGFHWLVSRGFDVFGLIESGQAIRKEMGNGNS